LRHVGSVGATGVATWVAAPAAEGGSAAEVESSSLARMYTLFSIVSVHLPFDRARRSSTSRAGMNIMTGTRSSPGEVLAFRVPFIFPIDWFLTIPVDA
jgi:hypothetical protein